MTHNRHILSHQQEQANTKVKQEDCGRKRWLGNLTHQSTGGNARHFNFSAFFM